jgi:hypothetical protein
MECHSAFKSVRKGWNKVFEDLLRYAQITHYVLSEMKETVGPSAFPSSANLLFSLEQPFLFECDTRWYVPSAVARANFTRARTDGLLDEAEEGSVPSH